MKSLEALGNAELRELLLATSEQRVDERFFTQHQLHPAIELQHYFDEAAPELRSRLKIALSSAVAEWRARAHGLPNLRFLAHSAGAVRARDTAPHLARIVQRSLSLTSAPAEEQDDVAGDVLATLAGFAPGDDIASILERLFYRPGLLPSLAGVLLQGLCRCQPEKFASFLERYQAVVKGSSVQHFDHPIFLRLFVEAVTPVVISNHWPELPSATCGFLIEKFSRLNHLDLYYALDEEGPALFESSGEHSIRFTLRGDSIDQRYEDARQSYRLQAQDLDLTALLKKNLAPRE